MGMLAVCEFLAVWESLAQCWGVDMSQCMGVQELTNTSDMRMAVKVVGSVVCRAYCVVQVLFDVVVNMRLVMPPGKHLPAICHGLEVLHTPSPTSLTHRGKQWETGCSERQVETERKRGRQRVVGRQAGRGRGRQRKAV